MRSSGSLIAAGIVFLTGATALAEPPRKHLLHLSSEPMAGREVGTEGHDLARDYIQQQMARAGLAPGGINGSWFVPVSVVRRVTLAPATMLRIGDSVLAPGVGYQLTGFTDEVTFDEAPIFAGYGLSAAQAGWDDYAGIDVRGRVVLAFTGAPPKIVEGLDPADAYLLQTTSKAAVALGAGARAIIFVQDPRTHGDGSGQRPDTLAPITPDFALRDLGAAVITAKRATDLLGAAGLDLFEYQQMLDEAGPRSVEVPVEFSGHFQLEREVVESDNVVGKLLGTSDVAPVALGAHYDHLGLGGAGSRYQGPDVIHPGADDNASGVAVLLSVATRLAAGAKPQRTVLFVATTGEERGLRGARQAAHVLRGDQAGAYVNLDMVGRLRQDVLHSFGVSETADLGGVVEDLAKEHELQIEAHPREASISDHVAFYDRGWTSISFSTGRHADYHLPTDTIDQIAWRGLDRVDGFIAALVEKLANR